MNNSKTILVFIFLMAGTSLTTTAVTIVPAAYAGGDDHDNGDGNKNKAEEESAAAIADCDDNDVEQAGVDCIAIASDVEIEPPEEESTTLSVCKETSVENTSPSSFTFTVTGNNPSDNEFTGDDIDGCVDITIDPGEYAVSEAAGGLAPGVEIMGDCEQDPINPQRATGVIETGETQEECRFINSPGAS